MSIHGDSTHPKIDYMNHLLEMCIAFDGFRSNLAHAVSATGTCFGDSQLRVAEFHPLHLLS